MLATLVMGGRSLAQDRPNIRELVPEHVLRLHEVAREIHGERRWIWSEYDHDESDLGKDDAPFLAPDWVREALEEHREHVQEVARLIVIETAAFVREPEESRDTFLQRGNVQAQYYRRAVELLCVQAETLGRRGETEQALQLLEPVFVLVSRRGNFGDPYYSWWCLSEFGELLGHVAQTVAWEPEQCEQLHSALRAARDDLGAIAPQAVSVFVEYNTEATIFGKHLEDTDAKGNPMPEPEERMRRIERLLAEVFEFFPDPDAGEQIEPLGSDIQYLMAPLTHPHYNEVLEMFTRHHQVRSALNSAVAATAPAP
ncbi:MAG: hypothetical protein AAGD00_00585 [Planctomycetota bacterium]